MFQGVSDGLIINSSPIGEVSKTRDSRLFKSNFDYVRKSIAIIIKSVFLYKIRTAFVVLSILFFTPGILLLSRFFLPYFLLGSNPGNIQSLIVGTGYITILFVFLIYLLIRIDSFKKFSELKRSVYKPKHSKT